MKKLIFANEDCFLISFEDITPDVRASILKDQSNYKTQILQSFSHELRTPLNGSITPIEQCLEDTQCPENLKKKYLQNAFGSLAYLEIVLNNIVDFAEIFANQFKPNPSFTNILALIEQVTKWVKLQLNLKKHISLEIDVDDNGSNIFEYFYTDHFRLRQILVNLLSNAIKFTTSGTIFIKIKLINPHCINFIIQDSGVGIPPQKLIDLQKFLMNPFLKEMPLTSQTSCLGLAVTQNIILYLNQFAENSGLTISSELNAGSSFSFCLQEYRDSNMKIPLKIEKSLSQRENCQLCHKILIVDDDCFNLAALSNIFEKLKISYSKAYNGQEAINKIKNYYENKMNQQIKCNHSCKGFQLILMDYQMPILDGIQATYKLKEMMTKNIIPTIPIIGCTAFSSKKQIEECISSGMSEVVIKPITFTKVKILLEKWIEY